MTPTQSEKIGTVFKSERRRLLGYIKKKISDSLDAEDILQDVFYQLTVGFGDIRSIESITAWLYRVADNRMTDRFRKRKNETVSYHHPVANDDDGPLSLQEILPALGTSPEDEELKAKIWQAIEKTLDELPPEQSCVFVAHEFDELSFNDISAQTGVGVNTLISRKRYAVLALRENLNELYNLLKNH
jgi:RNA polymerase sigma factor (sigma-70 family)